MSHGATARICGGEAGGRALFTGKGLRVRPTPAGVREALGDILRERLPGAAVADLYAGYGCTGLELLSRGAKVAVFVERDRQAVALLRRNVAALGYDACAHVRPMGVASGLEALANEGWRFDIVFVDPPYETGEAAKTLDRLARHPELLAEGAVVVVQHSRREALDALVGPLERCRERISGDTVLSFYEQRRTR